MKLMASGVTNCAAITRSPSFSRSSSSTTTTIRPEAMSSSASSMVANLMSSLVAMRRHQFLDVLGHDVHFQVHGGALLGSAQGGALQGFGDQGHVERRVGHRGYGQRDAVHGDRALLDHIAKQCRVGEDRDALGETVVGDGAD